MQANGRRSTALALLLCLVVCLVSAAPVRNAARPCTCVDLPPPGNYSCAQQKNWNKCNKTFMTSGNYCAKSCGRCMCNITPKPAAQRAEVLMPAIFTIGPMPSPPTSGAVGAQADPAASVLPWPFSPLTAPVPKAARKQEAAPLVTVVSTRRSEDKKEAPKEAPAAAAAQPESADEPPPQQQQETQKSTSGRQPTDTSASPVTAAASPPPPPPSSPTAPSPALKLPDIHPDMTYSCGGNATIMSVIAESTSNTSTFRQALHWTAMAYKLADAQQPFTVFVPVDAGFDQLAMDEELGLAEILADAAMLKSVVAYHMTPMAISPARLASQSATPSVPTLWKGHLLFGGQPGYVYGEGTHAAILRSVHVCNAYVYFLDYVLLPTPDISRLPPFEELDLATLRAENASVARAPCKPGVTAYDVVKINPNLTVTARVLLATQKGKALADTHVTLLAPNDDAWEAAAVRFNTTVPQLLTDRDKLKSILQYHILSGKLSQSHLQTRLYAAVDPGVPPVSITVKPDEISLQSTTTDALVLAADIGNSCDVTVHATDAVLLPAALLAQPEKVATVLGSKTR